MCTILQLIHMPLCVCMEFHDSPRSVNGYWHQRADERPGNTPQGNQEPLVVKESKIPGELGVRKSMECDTFSFECFSTVG